MKNKANSYHDHKNICWRYSYSSCRVPSIVETKRLLDSWMVILSSIILELVYNFWIYLFINQINFLKLNFQNWSTGVAVLAVRQRLGQYLNHLRLRILLAGVSGMTHLYTLSAEGMKLLITEDLLGTVVCLFYFAEKVSHYMVSY